MKKCLCLSRNKDMDKNYLPIIAIGVGVFAVFVLGTGRINHPPETSGKLLVTASFYPLYFFASVVGGERADVASIVPYDIEPHEYEPAPRDIIRIEQSALILLNGGGLEPWDSDLRHTIDPHKTIIVEAAEGLATHEMEEDGKRIIDPHVWLSPELAGRMTDAIFRGFIAADPANRAEYEANAAALKERLADLDREYRDGLARCVQRDFITSHAAFGYLAAAYGLRQIPITGISSEEEPSPAALASLVRFAKEHKIRHIFFESMVSPKLSETIAREVGAATLVLDPVEGLAAEDAARGEDYFTKMRANLTNLKIALQCTP